ncbi:RpiR family transcriptional regulator [Amylibacter kogurei]|uniref:RpiR family transcriptional regulator n=1 Tax=Paramylibacter kogurei TaxID=1889778 RepID=A0A2G5K5C2_9RHOB|nr:MurR/RpiR family transcriptional regulator [Amylibacter kogurei]PIB24718.1 RpiR family transcriptional regulator [Amylibacter kogurei]
MASNNISDRLTLHFDSLTRAERQLANVVMENYPVSGLGSITELAEKADVSTPSVARLVQKLGFKGFPEFQAQLRKELAAKISGPIEKHDRWAENAPDTHILNRFTDAVMTNIRKSYHQIDTQVFDRTCELLADQNRSVYVVGGRITHALADYFFLHMQVIRPDVTHIQSISNAWPHYLLDVKQGDVIVVFDVRRYENSTLKLIEMAAAKGAEVVLITDQWISPISKFTNLVFAARISVPSAWDSSIVNMLILETIIARVQEIIWPDTRERMEQLESMFDETKFFRKFT